MKAVLVFKLPEEQQEHQFALKGAVYQAEISEFQTYLRSALKYGPSEELKSVAKIYKIKEEQLEVILDHIRQRLFELCPEALNEG